MSRLSSSRVWPQTLRGRLLAGVLGAVLVAIATAVLVAALVNHRQLDSEAEQALGRQVDLIAQTQRATGQRPPKIGQFLASEQEHLTVLTPYQAALLLPPAGAKRLARGLRAQGTLSLRGTSYDYAARREGGEALVILRPASNQAADWTPFLYGLGAAALAALAVGALIAAWLARAVARPVADVSRAARRLAAGEATPLVVHGPDEVAELAHSFNQLAEDLEQAQDSERLFLLSVSHELKTPLTVIRGHAEALADGVAVSQDAGQVIERESRRLERLIQDLLDLGRLRRRQFAVKREVVDLRAVADEALTRHQAQAEALGLALTAAGAGQAEADYERLLQVASNLIENALRVTPQGGQVAITVADGQLTVRDSGPGLATEELEHAFERFYLYERYGRERPVGTGLGLAIVQELSRAMGGQVTVSSQPGVGTTFAIALPPAPAGAPTR